MPSQHVPVLTEAEKEARHKRNILRILNFCALIALVIWFGFGVYFDSPSLLLGNVPHKPTHSSMGMDSITENSTLINEPYVIRLNEADIQSNDEYSSPFTTTIATIASTQTIAFIGNTDIDKNLYASIPRIAIANLENLDGQIGTVSVGRYIVLLNFGDSISLSRWKIFIDDKYFYEFPDFTIGKGRSVRIHIGSGEDGRDDLFANYSYSHLSTKSVTKVTLRDVRNAIIDQIELLEDSPIILGD